MLAHNLLCYVASKDDGEDIENDKGSQMMISFIIFRENDHNAIR